MLDLFCPIFNKISFRLKPKWIVSDQIIADSFVVCMYQHLFFFAIFIHFFAILLKIIGDKKMHFDENCYLFYRNITASLNNTFRLLLHGSYKWIIMLKKCGRPGINVFHIKWIIMAIEKIKILGALELPAKQQCQSSLFTSKTGQMGWIGSTV